MAKVNLVFGSILLFLFVSCERAQANPKPVTSLPAEPNPKPLTSLPVVKFEKRWATQLTHAPMHYGSASIQISGDTLFVLNGADVGNAILKFTLDGEYLGEYPGWYNMPIDLVLGGDPQNPQPLVSAIGAMNDTGYLNFGMVLYNRSGDFFHGFAEADTGLKRPYGMALIPGGDQLAVTDWQGNRTVFMDVGWTEGKLSASSDPIISVPYPARIAVSEREDLWTGAVTRRYVIASGACCEPWHEKIRAMRMFDQDGKLLKTVKDLPNGDKVDYPSEVAVDPHGNILLVELKRTTHFFDRDGNYIGDIEELKAPRKIVFHNGKVYTVGEDPKDNKYYVNVFTYAN